MFNFRETLDPVYDFDYSVNIFFVNIYHIYSELAQLADDRVKQLSIVLRREVTKTGSFRREPVERR